jgi:pSer/pThr/pTyr-binding forkhead associated (FHA) protein
MNRISALLPVLTHASEEPTQMTNPESPAGPDLLVVHSGESSHAIAPGGGIVTIGSEPQADVRIDDPQISEAHLQAVSDDGRWRIVDRGQSGMFVDGRRESSVTVRDKTTVRFGDPTGDKALTFEIVRPSRSPEPLRDEPRPSEESYESPTEPDPGLARAGAAAAARRRELDISQRRLAAEGIINAGALIAFEKGRSWPRERTRAKLEELLQWPAGTIARIRRGEPVDGPTTPAAPPTERTLSERPRSDGETGDGQASLIAQAVAAAVDVCSLAIVALPPTGDSKFSERLAPILADLRQLDGVVVQAMRIGRITPELVMALRAVRHYEDELMTLGATAPGAPLAQRLYAARRRANLSTLETAQVAGVDEQQIVRAEAEEALPADVTETLERLISQIG